MQPIYYITSLSALTFFIIKGGRGPGIIYISTWLILLLNFSLGPLIYPTINNIFYPSALATIYVFLFFAGYALGQSLLIKNVNANEFGYNCLEPKWITLLEVFGTLGVFTYFAGRLLPAFSYLASGDLAGLRSSFIENTNLLSQIGSILMGLYFFVISKFKAGSFSKS